MNSHVKLVAILHLALGALGLIGAMVTFAIIGLPSGIALWHGDSGAATIIGFMALCIGGFIALLSIPSIIGGWALLAQKTWARALMIVLGILDLFHFPLGTALGLYTLWVLVGAERGQRGSPVAPTAQALDAL